MITNYSSLFGRRAAIIMPVFLVALLFCNNASAQITVASDNAANYDTNGWTPNSNGGFGLTPWIIFTLGDTNNGFAGHIINSAVADGFGDIDTDGKSFGMFGYPLAGNPEAVAFRYFTNTGGVPDLEYGGRQPMLAGQAFTIDLAVAFRNGYKGVDLITTATQRLWNFGMDGDRRYEVNQEEIFGSVYDQHSIFKIRAEQLTDNTYRVFVTRGAEIHESGPFTGQIGGIKFYESSTSTDNVLNRLYFNNFKVERCAAVTTWNGVEWSDGEPNISTRAIFAGDFTLQGNLSACMITVIDGAEVLVKSGSNLTVSNTVTVVATGSLVIENDANLIQIENVTNTGNITSHKNSNVLLRNDYTLWSSPVTGQNMFNFSPQTLPARFYNYDTPTDKYVAVPNVSTALFELGKGYLIRLPNGGSAGYNAGTETMVYDGTFTGVPNNGVITMPLSTAGQGYNAVGNPYPSTLNFADFIQYNAIDNNNIDGQIWLWRKTNNSTNTSYGTMTMAGYIRNNTLGGGVNESEINVATYELNVGQGFIVKTNSSSLVFNNTMRGNTFGNPFFRNGAPVANKSRYWLNITSDAGAFSQTAVAYMEGATLNYDNGYDGRNFTDSNTSLYSFSNGINLAIQARPQFTDSDVILLGFKIAAKGIYTLSIENTDGVFAAGQDIFLRDNVTGAIHNIKDSGYSFSAEEGTYNDRFEVFYNDDVTMGAGDTVLNPSSVIIFKQDRELHINTAGTEMESVKIYDITGRIVYHKDAINAASFSVNNLNSSNQVLIIEVSTPKGKVNKKIVY